MGSTDPSTLEKSTFARPAFGRGQEGSVGRRRSVGKKDKKSYCVLRLKFLDLKFEVRVMGVGLFRFSPGIARFPKQSQFDS